LHGGLPYPIAGNSRLHCRFSIFFQAQKTQTRQKEHTLKIYVSAYPETVDCALDDTFAQIEATQVGLDDEFLPAPGGDDHIPPSIKEQFEQEGAFGTN
jgi:hypothetical protein